MNLMFVFEDVKRRQFGKREPLRLPHLTNLPVCKTNSNTLSNLPRSYLLESSSNETPLDNRIMFGIYA